MKKKKLKKKLAELEANSHPPVSFHECVHCAALVVSGRMIIHLKWHERMEQDLKRVSWV